MIDRPNTNAEEKKCDRCATRHCVEETGIGVTWKLMRLKSALNPEFGHIMSHMQERIEDCAIRKYLEHDQLPKPLDTQQ